MLHQMQQEGVQCCVMEVSSHAISQKRVHGLEFELGVFTQLTQDHLDFHHSMEEYFQTKRSFFTGFAALASIGQGGVAAGVVVWDCAACDALGVAAPTAN